VLVVPAIASAHVERASYWPDPAPDCSLKPCAGGMVPKIRAALAALGWEGSEAIIADGRAEHALERALGDTTFGTRITAAREASVGAA
jgi:glutamate 5-kinase